MLEAAKERTQQELEELKHTPLGYLMRAVLAKEQQITAEGRKPSSEDAAAFIEQIPDIVRYAREQEALK